VSFGNGASSAGWGTIHPVIVGRFDPDEKFVPFVMFAERRGVAAGEGLVEQLRSEDMVALAA
jgi:hypothetical protein